MADKINRQNIPVLEEDKGTEKDKYRPFLRLKSEVDDSTTSTQNQQTRGIAQKGINRDTVGSESSQIKSVSTSPVGIQPKTKHEKSVPPTQLPNEVLENRGITQSQRGIGGYEVPSKSLDQPRSSPVRQFSQNLDGSAFTQPSIRQNKTKTTEQVRSTEHRLDGGIHQPASQSRTKPASDKKDLFSESSSSNKTLYASAENTYKIAQKTTSDFTDQGSGLPTSSLYYFAKLYELITKNEVALAKGEFKVDGSTLALKHPEFLLEFIPIFYNMYRDNLTSFLSHRSHEVTTRWYKYFILAKELDDTDNLDFIASLKAGIEAHVKGDMSKALEEGYRKFSVKHPEIPFNNFGDLHHDFFELNKYIFIQTQNELLAHFAKIGRPLDKRFGEWADEKTLWLGTTKIGSVVSFNIDEIYDWRQLAWDDAAKTLKKRGR